LTGHSSSPHPHARGIRSFVRREGRLTPGQQNALQRLWPHYGLSADERLDPVAIFGRSAALTLEIGFGNGASLAAMAAAEPDRDFIGIEVHRPGVGQLLKALEAGGLENVRVFCDDAVDVLNRCIDDRCLERVLLLFPDPWPKKKHHKRRIVQPAFVALLARKLKAGGLLHMATDWQPYAEHMQAVVAASPAFRDCRETRRDPACLPARPATRFEQRGRRLGHAVTDLLYLRRRDAWQDGADSRSPP
jgi:tRNA (guanine-N7-)-methyltransferase